MAMFKFDVISLILNDFFVNYVTRLLYVVQTIILDKSIVTVILFMVKYICADGKKNMKIYFK
jgi:hypothetical protein